MADYVTVNGVRTWYDERGEGEPVVLLHGGLSDSRCFSGNLDRLAANHRLLLPERRGHGHTPDVPGPLTSELMAADTIAFLETLVGRPAPLVGYSAGATVALRVALERPDLVERLVLVSGAIDPAGMLIRPDPEAEPPAEIVAMYAEVSPDGPDHFPVVVRKIAAAMEEERMDPAQLAGVECRTLVLAGDDDLVTLEHTLELYRGIPRAELAIVPCTSHLLLFERPELCTRIVAEFLEQDPPPSLMPLRRASQAGAAATSG